MADIEEHLPKRKRNRLKSFDYSFCGAYFVTICVSERRNIFWNNVGATIGRPPEFTLSSYGKIADDAIKNISAIYHNLSVDHYVIMPRHKRAERLTVLTDIFSPDTAADGLEICPILPSPSFLSRQKSVPLKLRAPKTDYFCPRFVEDDAGIPGVFQGGQDGISAKRTVFGVRVRFSYA